MDNRNQKTFEQRFLSPLKNRPGLEPDEAFVENLRAELIVRSTKGIRRKFYWNWPILVSMGMAVMLFSILTASYIGSDGKSEHSRFDDSANRPVTQMDENEKTHDDKNLKELISKNKAYDIFYKEVTKITGSKDAAEKMILYFDALESGDSDYIKEIILFEFYDQPTHEVIEHYKSADFTTLKMENMYPDQNDAFNVIYSFTDRETGNKVRRRLLINTLDPEHIKVIDSVASKGIDSEKDRLIEEKAAYLQKAFKQGMTEAEVIETFGAEFKEYENSDAEDGTYTHWTYEFFKDPGTRSNVEYDFQVDFENIAKQNIGILFTIGWTRDGKAVKMSMFYSQKGKIFYKIIYPDGTFDDGEQKAGEINYGKTEFELTEEEQEAYNWFKLEYDRDNLRELSPISVAKLYVFAGIEGDAETQYALYTARSDRIMWSKEEHLKFSQNENVTKEQILEIFAGIQDGDFIETSDYEGYISFENENGTHGFQMVKDHDGIWKVGFMPIQ